MKPNQSLVQQQQQQLDAYIQEFRSILNVNFPRAFDNPKDVAIRHEAVQKLKVPVNPMQEAFKKAGL